MNSTTLLETEAERKSRPWREIMGWNWSWESVEIERHNVPVSSFVCKYDVLENIQVLQ